MSPLNPRVLVTLRYRGDPSDEVRAWGTGDSFADAIYFLARHRFVVNGPPEFGDSLVMRVYQGSIADRRLAALEPPPEAPP
jgi:hypothetical protein